MINKLKIAIIFLWLINLACINAFGQNIQPIKQEVCKNGTAKVQLMDYYQGSEIKWQKFINGKFEDIQNSTGSILVLNDNNIQIVRCVVKYSGETTITNTSEIIWIELPSVKFDIELPCTEQQTRFVISNKNSNIISYLWKVDNLFESVLESPEFIFENPGNYNVNLKVVNDKSCSNTLNKKISISPKPSTNVNYDSIICGNSYTEFKVVHNNFDTIVNYEWNLYPANNRFFTINGSNSDSVLKINWGIVKEPINLNMSLKLTNNQECYSTTYKQILLKTDIAPDFGTIFQKPYNSDVLIYKDESDLNKKNGLNYQWGMDNTQYGEYFYCLFPNLNPAKNTYWVDTYFSHQPTCKTRNYFDLDNFLGIMPLINQNALQVYPNPTVGYLVLNLKFLLNKQINIEIRDQIGSLVYKNESVKVSSESLSLNLNGLNEGFYLLSIICDNEKLASTKFLINK